MAKKKRTTKRTINPVTARKTAKGIVVSATVATMDAAKKLAKKMGVTTPRVGNVEQGFMAGGVFHPIRASSDYRPEALSDSEGARARSGTRKKKAKAKNKPAARMTAKRKR